MKLQVWTEDEYVIHVDCNKICVIQEEVVHVSLESGWSIHKAKRHDKPLEIACRCSEGGV